MKDHEPTLIKKEVSFENVSKELKVSNAISTGGNCCNPYVVICKSRSLENCGTCNLKDVCSKALSDNSLKDLKP